MRIMDVEQALSGRTYAADAELTFELTDAFRPESAGAWRLEASSGNARVTRADAASAELLLDVADLACVYLGAFTFQQLVSAGRVEERAEGALERADALFRTPSAPWCPEIF
jgi:predicted acetyltransferase